jgi:4-amino-4-deoxy-L-arabinose transferase-like glycosyltransferase
MSRTQALLIVCVLWAAIYLPGLGSTEIKGEEGRRILPAVTMLETGDWLVPYVGGKPFLRKPPLMNWVIAFSFKATGVRKEWSARLPSALAVLAMGLVIASTSSGGGWLQPRAGLAAAIMAMTSFGLLAKARFAGAEIEGVYVPLFGIAMTCWLAWWFQERSPWFGWTVPFVFLGLGALAKGPLHVLFFYAVVAAVLAREKAWRTLAHPAHFFGLGVMAGIFAAWAVPYRQLEVTSEASKVWRDQMTNRFTENQFELASYLSNLPRGVGDLLPWILFVPLVVQLWRKNRSAQETVPAWRSGMAILFVSAMVFTALLLIPGVLPRYVLPLAVPWILVLAWLTPEPVLMRWLKVYAVILVVGSLLFALVIAPQMNRRDDLRPLAAEIDEATPDQAELILYDLGYQPAIFYLRSRYRYANRIDEIPARTLFVLARAKDRKKLLEKRSDLQVTREFRRKENVELILLEPARS